ncbi:MAG: hypothetical protein ABH874_04470 [Methanobacteriota archaeon]
MIALVIAILIVPGVHAAASIDFQNTTVTIFFDKPKGTAASFSTTDAVLLSNRENATAHVSGLTASLGISGVNVSLGSTSATLDAYGSTNISITFTVPATMGESSYTGTLTISGTNAYSLSKSIVLKVVYPNATLNAVWDRDWGKVRAGSMFIRVLNVSEVMGYRSAGDVSVLLSGFGPANINYSGILGSISTFGSKSMNVTVAIPERNLRPDTYNITPLLSSSSAISVNAPPATYIVPVPEMLLSEASLDLGKITFEPGKDTSEKILIVRETGNYTPIEGFAIALKSGEEGWISYSKDDYIPPGSSKNYSFMIYLPQDATIGEKKWVFGLSTWHAGSREVAAKVMVYFPGIEEALTYLQGKGQIGGYAESRYLIGNTSILLEKLKGVAETRTIAMAMSVYTGTRTFITNIEEAIQSQSEGKIHRVGDAVIKARTSLNRMKIGNENLEDKDLRACSNASVASAEKIWNSAAQNALLLLDGKASESKDSNYKFTSLYYKRMSAIYALLGNSEKSEEYFKRQKEMENLYASAVSAAIDTKNGAEEELENARKKMLHIGDSYFILNPLAFDFVMGKYDISIKKYQDAEILYGKAGESSDADLVSDIISTTAREKASIYRSFLAYGIFLVALFVGFLIRVSIGVQNFKRDEEDGKIGEIILKSEAKI